MPIVGSQWNIFIILAMNWQLIAAQEPYCFSDDAAPYSTFGSQTAYDTARGDLNASFSGSPSSDGN